MPDKNKEARAPSLNANSLAGLRDKYERYLLEKDEGIRKNEAEIEVKEKKLGELEQAGKTLDCDKMRRQIDTHRKFVKQAQDDKLKIQEKLDNL
jgi:hypothetical protein